MVTRRTFGVDGRSDRAGLSSIIDAARNGGQEAIHRLLKVTDVYCRIWALKEISTALQRTCDESDIRQECDIDVVRGIRSFRGRSREFLGWLRQIVRTNAIDQQRRHGKRVESEGARNVDLRDYPVVSSADPLLQFEQKELVETAMGKLSADHRAVLRMRVWEGLKWGEIGERMNRSTDAARLLFARALDAVRGDLTDGPDTVP